MNDKPLEERERKIMSKFIPKLVSTKFHPNGIGTDLC